MNPDILRQDAKASLAEFLQRYDEACDIDLDVATEYIKLSSAHYDARGIDRSIQRRLECQWYDALDRKEIDYSVYANPYYPVDLWFCWRKYSRRYILDMVKHELFPEVNSIMDLGCGIGYSTAALKQIFPRAIVCGTDLESAATFDLCMNMAAKFEFYLLTDAVLEIEVDLVFASEYFEHIEDPIDELIKIIDLNPKFFYIANSFNTCSTGHFQKYKRKGMIIDQSEMSRRFNESLRAFGYKKRKTKLWNQRPAVWDRT